MNATLDPDTTATNILNGNLSAARAEIRAAEDPAWFTVMVIEALAFFNGGNYESAFNRVLLLLAAK